MHRGQKFVLCCHQEVTTMKNKEKPKYNLLQTLRFMLRCAWKARKSVPFVCVAMALIAVGQSLCQLYVAPQILGKVEAQAPISQLLGTIALFAMLGFVLAFLKSYGNENRMMGEIDVRSEIIRLIGRKACTTSFPNTRDPAVQKLQERARSATDGNSDASEHIWRTLTEVLQNGLGLAVYVLLLSQLEWVLMAVVLAASVMSYLVSRQVNGWEYKHREENNQLYVERTYITRTARSNTLAKDIRLFGLAPWLRELYEKAAVAYEAFVARRQKVILIGNVADVVLTFLRNGIAYYYLISMVLTNGLTASEFLLYFSAVSGLSTWVTGLLKQFAQLHRESIEISCIQEYLSGPEQFRFQGGTPVPKAEGYELQLENVTFRYPGTDKNILENVNLTIHPGEKLAVVGLNGAGKTTLVLLLGGFYDPDAGRVLLNGQDIREFNRNEYYDLFSAVFQEFSLLDVTIAQQVAQRATDIDEERVWACLGKAGLTEFVKALPNGLETHMGREVYLDGILLSGGQTQRLVLARALYKDGPILMLDEPTAALDPIAENDIYQKYNEMTAGKTSLFISHRLASTRFCDRILFIADGGIAEEGTHEALLALGGRYAKLFEVQSRYYREGGENDGEEI